MMLLEQQVLELSGFNKYSRTRGDLCIFSLLGAPFPPLWV